RLSDFPLQDDPGQPARIRRRPAGPDDGGGVQRLHPLDRRKGGHLADRDTGRTHQQRGYTLRSVPEMASSPQSSVSEAKRALPRVVNTSTIRNRMNALRSQTSKAAGRLP